MQDYTLNNKRIAKNTLLLYFRMLLIMVVNLYTSRIVLNALGVEDYGIYNVVGGVVSMFTILSGSLSAAISRFITFELGCNNKDKLYKVFSSAITIQLLLSIIIVLLSETLGLWFLNNKMLIPENRILAANWVYHLSVISFVITLIGVPYNAAIIAYEKMAAYAYISILEVVGKLIIAFSIYVSVVDKLIYYALGLTLISLLVQVVYIFYCRLHLEACRYRLIIDKSLLKEMFGFAGWNFIGAASGVLRDQGGSIIINLFYGPSVNAARGIAIQVSHAVQGFASNFMKALNPQITKSYACGNYDYMMSLIFQGARLSFYILFILSLPVIINVEYILTLWLGIVPEYTVVFVQLVLVFVLSESLANPLITAMLATGNIKKYQLLVGGLQILNLPISYILLLLDYQPEIIFVVAIIISICCEFARLYMLKDMIVLSVPKFFKEVIINVILVSIIASIIPLLLKYLLTNSTINFMLNCMACLVSTFLSILYVGCNKNERTFIYKKIRLFFYKIKNIFIIK